MKKLLFLGACLMALASQPVMAQTTADLVLVRFDRRSTGDLRISITRGEGKTELTQVNAGYTDKGFVATSEAEYKVLQQLYREGYALLNSTATSDGSFAWIFTKKQ